MMCLELAGASWMALELPTYTRDGFVSWGLPPLFAIPSEIQEGAVSSLFFFFLKRSRPFPFNKFSCPSFSSCSRRAE